MRRRHAPAAHHPFLRYSADNGIFTSSTWSEDWQTIHGILPRGFNQLRIQQVCLWGGV
jgi:hypothetical protein